MHGRERVRRTIDRQPTDRAPIDLGSTAVTGIQATTYARLRQALGLPDGQQREGPVHVVQRHPLHVGLRRL